MNAFTIPAQGIQIRQQSVKQIKQSATRVNRNDRACVPLTQSDKDRSDAITGKYSFHWKDQ